MPYGPHAFHARAQDSLIQERGFWGGDWGEDYIVAIYVRRVLMISFRCWQSQHWTNLDFLFAETPKTHCCYAYYAGFSCKGVSKDQHPAQSAFYTTALETGLWLLLLMNWLEEDISRFSDEDDQKKIATTKTLRKELEDRPVPYLQWEVSLI